MFTNEINADFFLTKYFKHIFFNNYIINIFEQIKKPSQWVDLPVCTLVVLSNLDM